MVICRQVAFNAAPVDRIQHSPSVHVGRQWLHSWNIASLFLLQFGLYEGLINDIGLCYFQKDSWVMAMMTPNYSEFHSVINVSWNSLDNSYCNHFSIVISTDWLRKNYVFDLAIFSFYFFLGKLVS
jgi:hypothetical protein